MTKPLNTQNEWIILMLIGAVAGFCLAHSVYMLKAPGSSPGRWCLWSWSIGMIHIWWYILILYKGEITHLGFIWIWSRGVVSLLTLIG